MYKTRHIESEVKELAKYAKTVLVVGARQVGKSTMLSHLYPTMHHLTFDPVQDLYGARQDPDFFLDNFRAPLILDEIQYVPELLPALKRRVDTQEDKGQYFLTGSQNLSVLKQISESLAGRVAIINLNPMTSFEIYSEPNSTWLKTYLEIPDLLVSKIQGVLPIEESLYTLVWRGGYPGLLETPNKYISNYFSSYVQTYVERDIRTVENIQDLTQFEKFLALSAALSAQEVNYSHLGREIGLTPATSSRWLSLLGYTYLWKNIMPYSNNAIKRISKKPKGYLNDTGFICYLQRISSPEALANHPSWGHLFETFCINMIIAQSQMLGFDLNFFHWRSSGGAEVDLILEVNNIFYPIEIKGKTALNKYDARGLKAFRESYPHLKIAKGLILYPGKEAYPVDKDTLAIPWHAVI